MTTEPKHGLKRYAVDFVRDCVEITPEWRGIGYPNDVVVLLASDADALIAAKDAEIAQCVEFNAGQVDLYRNALEEIAAKDAEIAGLREDAERYRYLKENAHPDYEDGLYVSSIEFTDWGKSYNKHYSGDKLDAAIDAARSKQEKRDE